MNCEADTINVMDQAKERDSRATRSFWNALGGKDKIQSKFQRLFCCGLLREDLSDLTDSLIKK